MKRYWTALLAIPLVLATAAMVPSARQDPVNLNATVEDQKARVRMAELHYVNHVGETKVVPAANVLQVRLLTDLPGIRIEVYYENGDYSMIDAEAVHIIRKGAGVQEVDLIRTTRSGMLYPLVP